MKGILVAVITTVSILTACTPLITKENTSTFDNWELCTLLYEPESLHANWSPMDDEDIIIRTELENRGLLTEADCSISSLSKIKCDEYRFASQSVEFKQCRLTVEIHIKEIKQMKKAANEAKQADNAARAQQALINMRLQQFQYRPYWRQSR